MQNKKLLGITIASVLVIMVGLTGSAQIAEAFSASAAYNIFNLNPGENETQYWGVSNILSEPIFVEFKLANPNVAGGEYLSFPANATIQPYQRFNAPLTVDIPSNHTGNVNYAPWLQVWKYGEPDPNCTGSCVIINQYYTNKVQINVGE